MHSSQVSTRTLRGDEIDFTAEARTIQRAAQMRVTRVVRLAELVFFSTAGGDAWMLDPGDGYAACLVRAGEPLAVPIAESTISLSVEWNADYRIEGAAFVVVERGGSTARTILGYPTAEIERLIREYPAEARTQAPGADAARARLKTGRNEPCPCGSGRKYKKCCLIQDEDLVSRAVAVQRAAVTRTELNEGAAKETVLIPQPSVRSKARDPVLEKRDEVWDAFEALEQPTREQMDEFLEGLLALPPEAIEWNDVLHDLAQRGYPDLPGAFRRIAGAVPYNKETAMGYFYWAAAEIFARGGHENVLPEVAAGFRRAGPEHYEDEALSHIEDVLLAAGLEDETLRLAEDLLPADCGSRERFGYHLSEQCDLIFDLRVGIALRNGPQTGSSVDIVATGLQRQLEGVADADFVRRCTAVICGTEALPAWTRAHFDMMHVGSNRSAAQQEYLHLYERMMAVAREAWKTGGISPGRALWGLSRLLRSVYEEWPERREKRKKKGGPANMLNYLNASAIEARVAGGCRDLLSTNVSRARMLLDAYEILLNFAIRHGLVSCGDAAAAQQELARLRGVLGVSAISRAASAA